jgi:hypothetical protein
MTIDMNKVRATGSVSLEKAVETAAVSLRKAGLGAHEAEVRCVLDSSASMGGFYPHQITELLTRVLGIALHFDDNGAVDIYSFDHTAKRQGEMDLSNFQKFVNGLRLGGGTNYAPAMKLVRDDAKGKKRFGRSKASGLPTYCIFVTDGAPFDGHEAEQIVRESADEPIFWQFVSLGSYDNPFLSNLDNMPGRTRDNASYFSTPSPTHFSDEELYQKLMKEYPYWVSDVKTAGLIK